MVVFGGVKTLIFSRALCIFGLSAGFDGRVICKTVHLKSKHAYRTRNIRVMFYSS